MPESLLTKRLHISGLTPSITAEDLGRRLSSFGEVKAMDGFGARDALGDPRKFAFVTMEIGAKELQKCLNVLSGSTWKGTRLRIGEAKPDFQERLSQINSKPPRATEPKRTRGHNYGRPSSTLPLTPFSTTAAASIPGWVVTPSGRVVRPMRMRPERPLEPMCNEPDTNLNGMKVKVKKRVKLPPVRARRRLIDPTKWDSAYLKGVFLDAVPLPSLTSRHTFGIAGQPKHDIIDEEDREVGQSDTSVSEGEGEDEPFEVITRNSHEGEMEGGVRDKDVEMEELSPTAMQAMEPAPPTNLKALFAPREDASFSLLEHLDLDLDLELDAEIFGINAPSGSSQEINQLSQPVLSDIVQVPVTTTASKARSKVTLDPSHPLLFPLPDSLPHPHSSGGMTTIYRNTPACFLFPSGTRSWNLHHLPTSISFARSPQDTSESIRERWEKDKSALTHEWKKAWRDARGSKRGGKGADGEVGGY